MWWQIALVVIIELCAVLFLVRKLWPHRPRMLERPDVPARDLLRKKKGQRDDPGRFNLL